MDHLFLLSPHLSVSQPRFLLLPVASPHTLRYRGTAERARCTDPICILKILHARIFPTSIRGTSLSRFWFFEECVSANAALALSPKVFPFCAEDTLFADLASLPQCHTPFQELEPHKFVHSDRRAPRRHAIPVPHNSEFRQLPRADYGTPGMRAAP